MAKKNKVNYSELITVIDKWCDQKYVFVIEEKNGSIIIKEDIPVNKRTWTDEQKLDLDKRFNEQKAYTDMKFNELKDYVDQRINELKDYVDKRFDEIYVYMDKQFNRLFNLLEKHITEDHAK